MTPSEMAAALAPVLQAQVESDRDTIISSFGMIQRMEISRYWDTLTAALPNFGPSVVAAMRSVLMTMTADEIAAWIGTPTFRAGEAADWEPDDREEWER